MTLTRLAGMVLPVLLLAGCGGSDGGTSPADKALRTYFDDIATQTVPSLRDAVQHAAPGSPAAAYATYLQVSTQAAKDGGQPIDPKRKTADRTAAGFRFCQGSETDHVCYDFAKIARTHGLVSDFSVNGKPISGRLAVGNGGQLPFAGVDAKAAFVAAYRTTATGKLFVVVRITTGGGTTLGRVDASYRSPSHAESASTTTLGRPRLAPGSSGYFLFAFPGATVGGTITVSASGNGHRGSVALDIAASPAR